MTQVDPITNKKLSPVPTEVVESYQVISPQNSPAPDVVTEGFYQILEDQIISKLKMLFQTIENESRLLNSFYESRLDTNKYTKKCRLLLLLNINVKTLALVNIEKPY